MRLLVDENLSVRVGQQLAEAGHDVVHVTEVGLANTDDPVILAWAAEQDRVVVTADSDFTDLLALGGASRPSVILVRSSDHLTPPEQASLLAAAIPVVAEDLATGAVVSLTTERMRVRLLPIRDN